MASLPAGWQEELDWEKSRACVDAQIAYAFIEEISDLIPRVMESRDWMISDLLSGYMNQYWERMARQATDELQEIVNGGETPVPDNSEHV